MAYHRTLTDEDQKKFAERLKNFRKQYGLTQLDLSAAMGCTERTIRSLERCENAPFPQTLIRFGELVERYAKAEEAESELMGIS